MKDNPKGKTSTKTAVQTELKNGSYGFVLPDPLLEWQDQRAGKPVIVLRSSRLGDHTISDDLGESLMTEFVKTIAASPAVPAALLLYGSAVCLVAPDSPFLDLLRKMQKGGCEILCCRISYAGLIDEDKPPVGQLADWVELTDRMQKAKTVLWP
ncbi:MAG: hypothetical protein SCM11_17280 [Bacillota bacterium]|nr:hypothetical protein [Bacillota bacterium]